MTRDSRVVLTGGNGSSAAVQERYRGKCIQTHSCTHTHTHALTHTHRHADTGVDVLKSGQREALGWEVPCFNSWGEILSHSVRPGNGSSPGTTSRTAAAEQAHTSTYVHIRNGALGSGTPGWALNCDGILKAPSPSLEFRLTDMFFSRLLYEPELLI